MVARRSRFFLRPAVRVSAPRDPGYRVRMPRALVALLAAATLAGCGGGAGGTVPPASAGVNAYLRAVRADDPRAAYELLSERARATTSYDEFAAAWRGSRAERSHAASALRERVREGDLGERAAVTYPDGKRVHLVRERGGWRMESPLVSRHHAGRPRDALHLLAAALERSGPREILAVLTEERREVLRARLDAIARGLSKHIDDPLERVGSSRAELEWRDGGLRYRIVVREEDGEWRVHDLHITGTPES